MQDKKVNRCRLPCAECLGPGTWGGEWGERGGPEPWREGGRSSGRAAFHEILEVLLAFPTSQQPAPAELGVGFRCHSDPRAPARSQAPRGPSTEAGAQHPRGGEGVARRLGAAAHSPRTGRPGPRCPARSAPSSPCPWRARCTPAPAPGRQPVALAESRALPGARPPPPPTTARPAQVPAHLADACAGARRSPRPPLACAQPAFKGWFWSGKEGREGSAGFKVDQAWLNLNSASGAAFHTRASCPPSRGPRRFSRQTRSP